MSPLTRIRKLLSPATLKCWPLATITQLSSPARFTSALPLIICIVSALDVEKVYSPAAITPTLAGDVLLVKLIDFTLPLKYSLTLNIALTLNYKAR